MSISNAEKGKVYIGTDLLERIALALGVPPARLIADKPLPVTDTVRKELDALLRKGSDKKIELIYKVVDAIIN